MKNNITQMNSELINNTSDTRYSSIKLVVHVQSIVECKTIFIIWIHVLLVQVQYLYCNDQ